MDILFNRIRHQLFCQDDNETSDNLRITCQEGEIQIGLLHSLWKLEDFKLIN